MYWCTIEQRWKESPHAGAGALQRAYMGPSEMSATLRRVAPAATAPALSVTRPSGPPDWYDQATKGLYGVVDAVLRVVDGHSYKENERDAFYLDRLTEALEGWAKVVRGRADARRKYVPPIR